MLVYHFPIVAMCYRQANWKKNESRRTKAEQTGKGKINPDSVKT